MSLVFVGLGSNLGNGCENLRSAWQRLGAVNGVTRLSISSPYRTAPVGMESDQWFTNAVGVIETRLAPEPFDAPDLTRRLSSPSGRGPR